MTAAASADLRSFVDALRAAGDLAEITVPVDPRLEAAEIHRRVIAAGGPALLFTNVQDADHRLVTNLFGTRRRAELAFGARPRRLIERLVALPPESLVPPTPSRLWSARDLVPELFRVGSRRVASGPVTEVVTRHVRLDRLPATTSWPEDGGPFLTLPLVLHAAPHDRRHESRHLPHAGPRPATPGMHWQIGKGGGFHYAVAEARGEALPVTVFLGGPPALISRRWRPSPRTSPSCCWRR